MDLSPLHNLCSSSAVSLAEEEGFHALVVNPAPDEEHMNTLEALGCTRDGRFSTQPGTLSLKAPRGRKIFVARDLDDLIEERVYRLEFPPAGYLINEKFGWSTDGKWGEPPNAWNVLSEVLRFFDQLRNLADMKEPSGSLVFVRLNKLVITPRFCRADLESAMNYRDTLKNMIGRLSAEDFNETRQDIFRGSLIDFLQPHCEAGIVGFGTVLRRIASLEDRYTADLQIYFNEHGFEKLRDSAIERKLAIGAKIDRFVARIEAVSLTIPPAIYLVAREAEPGKRIGPVHEFSTNWLLLLSSLIFFCIMVFSHVRQNALNHDLSTDCKETAKDFATQGGEKYGKTLRKKFDPLITRLEWANRLSWARLFLGALPAIIVFFKAF